MASTCITEGIQIDVSTVYLADYSSPAKGHYLFSYKIRMHNKGETRAKLKNRKWIIIDGDGKQEEVSGPGVVGKYPDLGPGDSFEYFSFCHLSTEFGTMEGHYIFEDDEGREMKVDIARFYLSTNLNEFSKNAFRRGQIVRHKLYNYRGVIVDYDICFLGDEDWYRSNRTHPPQNEPWYHVLINSSDKISYVAEQNLEIDPSGAAVTHPLVDFFFDGQSDDGYVRNDRSWNDLRRK